MARVVAFVPVAFVQVVVFSAVFAVVEVAAARA